ncbi:MAG: PAS domain-containing sensor histidine kinase [Sediminibacterium sp.]|jgi:PAS domain S-box-containing protein|uniref:PAS domain-containing sensor histidine kinase n=1 Tax=Sediminibacterium sp. TaxID=1917865 RepID=UPI002ABCEAA5|nr:PAS domain-containing sensor histidine kinase [Sediminibacterium sp.]MDZ4070570.1 PAS domain-containing sensor histidine kinase [Sediminibacterium sp.]
MGNESTIPRILQTTYIPTAEFYSQVIDSLLDYSIFTLNTELAINSWNAGATGIFQYESEEILGQPFHTIFTPTDIADGIPEKEIEQAIKEGKAIDNRWHICKDGKKIFAYGLVFPLLGVDGEMLGFVKILRDITEKKATADAIDVYVKDLEILNTHKDHVIALLSHDLRSPLIGFISLLEHTSTHLHEINITELKNILNLLHTSARKELDQLDNLVEWGRIKYASETFSPTDVNLAHILKRVYGILSGNILTKNIELISHVEDPFMVFADIKMLQSILQNIISNAIKFSHQGGIISITATKQENSILITITDHGVGMNKETLAHIFKPQLSRLTERRTNDVSAGIGLLLSKNLVEKHGGKIWAVSKENEGTSFFFSLMAVTKADDSLKENRKAFFEDYQTTEDNNNTAL